MPHCAVDGYSLPRRGGQEALHQVLGILGDAAPELDVAGGVEVDAVVAHGLLLQLRRVVARERRVPAQHHEQHHAQGPQVRPLVVGPARVGREDLGAAVLHGAGGLVLQAGAHEEAGVLAAVPRPGTAEVAELDLQLPLALAAVHEDVLRLDVPVRDLAPVQELERQQQLNQQLARHHFAERGAGAVDGPRDELEEVALGLGHAHLEAVGLLLERQQRHDEGTSAPQTPVQLGLPAHQLGHEGLLGQHLDGHHRAAAGVHGLVHLGLAERARPDLFAEGELRVRPHLVKAHAAPPALARLGRLRRVRQVRRLGLRLQHRKPRANGPFLYERRAFSHGGSVLAGRVEWPKRTAQAILRATPRASSKFRQFVDANGWEG
eukprot:scaffold498_cov348-Pinguiococcus_pyrenoidosus.AAC.8